MIVVLLILLSCSRPYSLCQMQNLARALTDPVCQYDFAEGRNDILRCGLVEEHRTGAALAEAEEIQASLKWSHRARQ